MTLNAWNGLPDPEAPKNLREGEPYNDPKFEELARTYGIWGTAQSALCAQFWQAARRAPVEPQEWKITEEMHVAAVKVLHRASGVDGLPQRMVDAMLAAAPQPSEVEKCQSCRTGSLYACTCPFKTHHNSEQSCFEVEKVQLPEPEAAQSRMLPDGGWGFCSIEHALFSQDWDQYETRLLYTEQQVRQLLAEKDSK